ncbi:MAG: tetraacyldisaccharide 4'-kinase, partial [Bacteroidales bacterium]|nr:tetraacyldisaccharide 4'-kinase [Bacteroidales bacterium]
MGIYGWVTQLRNHAFDKQWVGFKTKTFPQVKSICVGNLSVGGTGKTPMVVYITRRFLEQGKTVVVISLGYKRRKLG